MNFFTVLNQQKIEKFCNRVEEKFNINMRIK